MIGEEDQRLASRRNLDRATDQTLRRQFMCDPPVQSRTSSRTATRSASAETVHDVSSSKVHASSVNQSRRGPEAGPAACSADAVGEIDAGQ